MHPVIRPQHNDRAFCMGAFIKGIQQPAHLRIGKTDGGQIAANGATPLIIIQQPLMPLFSNTVLPGLRYVFQIVFLDLGKKHIFLWIEREIFLGRVPRNVRAENADCVKERLFARFLQLARCPVNHLVIGCAALGLGIGPPVKKMRGPTLGAFPCGNRF